MRERRVDCDASHQSIIKAVLSKKEVILLCKINHLGPQISRCDVDTYAALPSQRDKTTHALSGKATLGTNDDSSRLSRGRPITQK